MFMFLTFAFIYNNNKKKHFELKQLKIHLFNQSIFLFIVSASFIL